mgnify:CR=1 FL=1
MEGNKRQVTTEVPWLLEIDNPEHLHEVLLISRALSSPIRIEILKLLNKRNYIMSEIADELNLQPSSAAFHLKALEDAGLITSSYSTKYKGTLKHYSYSIRDITFRLRPASEKQEPLTPFVFSLSIGEFCNAGFTQRSGMASHSKILVESNPDEMFSSERFKAEYIWNMQDGFLTYAIPNSYAHRQPLTEIQFSMEICSEVMGYNEDFPSDITFSINGVDLCTWTCPGSYGDKYGIYTPSWWYPESTKYGLLTTVKIKEKGVFVNEKLINRNVGLNDLKLSDGLFTELKIEVKKTAHHCGGFSLFGENFGNYNQGIIFTAFYRKSELPLRGQTKSSK